jgi:hypothetical protein
MILGSGLLESLSPGKTNYYRFNLAHLFDLSRIGNYTVSVSVSPTIGPLKFQMAENITAHSGRVPLTHRRDHHTVLYTVGEASISRFRVEEDGTLSPALIPTPLPSKYASSLVVTPDSRFLYVGVSEAKSISQFRIGADGVLTTLSPPIVPNQFPGTLLMDPKGRFLCASGNEGSTLYDISQGGRLTARLTFPSIMGVKAAENASGLPNSNTVMPAGIVLYTGGSGGYRVGPHGKITPLPEPARKSIKHEGKINWGFTASQDNRFAFILSSTFILPKDDINSVDAVITSLRVGADGGLIPMPGVQTLPGSSTLPYTSRSLVIDPTGHFLLAVLPKSITRYRIGPAGSLTRLGVTPLAGEDFGFCFGPDGHNIYLLSQRPYALKAFRLDKQGGLSPLRADLPDAEVPGAFSMAAVDTSAPQNWGQPTEGLQVSVRLNNEIYSDKGPVILTAVLRNISSRPIRLGTAGSDMTAFRLALVGPQLYEPERLGARGEAAAESVIPLLAAGHDILEKAGPSTTPLVLPPGGQRQYRFLLPRLADMTLAGNYTVRLTRVLPDGAVAASPLLPFLLDGFFDGGTTWGPAGLDVP